MYPHIPKLASNPSSGGDRHWAVNLGEISDLGPKKNLGSKSRCMEGQSSHASVNPNISANTSSDARNSIKCTNGDMSWEEKYLV
ncbi:hypothetical protein Tco_0263713, partial [Tanacetum coccineum]